MVPRRDERRIPMGESGQSWDRPRFSVSSPNTTVIFAGMIGAVAKFVEPLFYPIGFVWLILTIAAIRYAMKKQRGPAWLCASLSAFLIVVGSTRLPALLLASLEKPFVRPSLDSVPTCDAVVMLGGTLTPSQRDPFGFDLADASDRAVTALELVRLKKAPVLILGGGGDVANPTVSIEAQLLQKWIAAWNLVAPQFITLNASANTFEEARQVKALMKEKNWTKIILVTSAGHMRRAEASFKKFEIPVEPVACDFVGMSRLEWKRPFNPFPEIDGFKILKLYLHEKLGWFYYRWRDWV
jgi:uncharacterized SAM-binding protein YcdF (DUF218 family)